MHPIVLEIEKSKNESKKIYKFALILSILDYCDDVDISPFNIEIPLEEIVPFYSSYFYNEKLNEIGYNPIFEYNEESAAELDWFYHLTGGHTHTDFFATRPTDYSKAGEDENWDEDELF